MKITKMYPLSILFILSHLLTAQSANPTTYCNARGTTPWEQWLERVTVANASGSRAYNISQKDGYGNFTAQNAAILLRAGANLVTISPTSSWLGNPANANLFWRVWIDLNNDNDFTDTGEQVISSAVTFTNGIFLDNERAFTIPTTATLGQTRLRVAMKMGGFPEPCETFDRGEVEDYTVQITEGGVLSCRQQDSLQLVALYNATGGANWITKWNLEQPMTTWTGVTLNTNGCVTQIQLVHNNLVGTLPNFNLPRLTTLMLNDNQLTGVIPIFTLPILNVLWLHNNQLSGCIPIAMRALCGKVVDISNNPQLATQSFTAFCNVNEGSCSTILPDLMMANLNLSTSSVERGQVLNWRVDIRNIGTSAAVGNFTIKAYISTDLILDNNDVQDGSIITGNYAAGQTNTQVTGATRIPANMPIGNYHLILIIDADNQIVESNESNNEVGSFPPFAVIASSQYCASKGTAPWEMWLSKVSLNNMTNNSTQFKDFATLGYSDFKNLTANVQKGMTYIVSATAGLSWTGNLPNAYCRVWVDWNQNKVFDEAELVFQNTNVNPFNFNLRIPISALVGQTRMRVSVKWGAYPTACETFDRGEVEDYTLQITEGVVINTCRYVDSLQLVNLYNATNGANWINKWNLNQPISTWYGVTLNTEGCVTVINLDNNGLSGTIPNLSFDKLEVIALRNNLLSGTIPNLVCPQLIGIYFADSQLSGTIPVFNCPNLAYLMLYNNRLTGSFPTLNYPRLVSLHIDGNQLTGSIPFLNQSLLRTLHLNHNRFTGSIPNMDLPLIEELFLNDNQLSGCITPSFTNFCGKNVSIANNSQLANQSFANFCSTNIGSCVLGADVSLGLEANSNIYRPYSPLTFNLRVGNVGQTALSNLIFEFKYPTGTVSGGNVTPSVGTWSEWCAGGVQCFEWRIPSLAINAVATLNVPLYVLNPSGAMMATARIKSSTPLPSVTSVTATINPAPSADNTSALKAKPKPTQLIPVVIQAIDPSLTEGGISVSLESLLAKDIQVNFFNLDGKSVKTATVSIVKGQNILLFEVYDLPQGMYFIQTSVSAGRGVPIKFIKL